MFNPIEAKRRFTEAQIQKSFDSGINLSEEMSLEKAKYQVGQPHPNNPNILWTEWQPGKFDWKSKNGRYWKGKTGGVSNKKAGANATDNEFKNVEFHHGQYYFNMGVDKHNYVILKKLSDKQVAKYKEYQEKRNKDALDAAISQAINDWKNTTNVDTPKKEKAWKKIVDKISVKRAHGYALTNEENYYWGMEQRGKRADSESDPRDKIAQDGGFKDYEEMKGYQDYVTQKNLLKKKSTKAGMRLLYQQEVAKYEKDHVDLIKRIGGNNKKWAN